MRRRAVRAAASALVALRITGLYLALITLVFGLTLEGSLFEVAEFTNAGAGQPADRPEFLFDDGSFYLFCLAFLAVAVYVDYRLTARRKTGRALLALKENERVAEAFGINVTAFKLHRLRAVAARSPASPGALFAYRIGIVTGSGFGFFLALTFVLMTVVGGLGSRIGVILGVDAVRDARLPARGDARCTASRRLRQRGCPSAHDARQPRAVRRRRSSARSACCSRSSFNPGGIAQQIQAVHRLARRASRSRLHGDEDAGPGAVEGSSVRA